MREIQFVYRNNVALIESIFVDFELTGTPEIDDTIVFNNVDNFTDAVILRAGAVVHKIANGKVIAGAYVVRINNRKPVEAV